MCRKINILLLLALLSSVVRAQQVNIGNPAMYPDALLSINSTTKGFLPPRLTLVQRKAIVKPATGLQIWCTDFNELQTYNGTIWINATGASAGQIPAKSVKICFTTWLEKNLDVRVYRNGDSIPVVTDATQWANLTSGAMCWYNNDTLNNATYGALYNWYAINDARGLAPTGWHIANAVDWLHLSNCLGGSAVAGGKMKDTGIFWASPNTGATNSKGFTALPAGVRNSSGLFEKITEQATWWVGDESNATTAKAQLTTFNNTILSANLINKNLGVSIRCVLLDN